MKLFADAPNALAADAAAKPIAAPAIWPGLALAAAIAALAFLLRQIPGVGTFSPMILSILLGMAIKNLIGTPALAAPGIKFAMRRILRFAIVLLGLQLTVGQIAEVGALGLGVIALTLVSTFAFTVWLGRLIGVERRLAELIAAGTSICGASAVMATNTVTRATDEDVAYAVAGVTVFGSIAMFVYPLLPDLLALSPRAYGLWTGASIHEIGQVVAAGFQNGEQAGQFAVVAKLSRVMLLAPVVMTLGLLATRRAKDGDGAGASAPVPWFVLGFIAMVGVASLFPFPHDVQGHVVLATSFLLSMALAAMGLETDFAKLCARGWRPLALGLVASLFIAGFSLMLVVLTT